MTKHFCDACGRECGGQQNGLGRKTLSLPAYIVETDRNHRTRGFIDLEGNIVCGRRVDLELCARCANTAESAAMRAVHEIRDGIKKKSKTRSAK